jgi:hypothetical protein
MKMKITKVHILALTVIALFLLCLNACSQKTDVSLFITKETFDKATKDCEGSTEKQCSINPFYQKVDKHCSDNKLSEQQCNSIKIAVAQKALEYRNQQLEEIRQMTDKLREATNNLKEGKR